MSNSYSKIAQSYSKAFLAVNCDVRSLKKSIQQLKTIFNAFNSDSAIGRFLLSSFGSIKDKFSLWQKISPDIKINSGVSAFITLMIENNRLNILGGVVYYIEKYFNESNGYTAITVESSCDIDDATKDSLQETSEKIFNSKIIAEFKTDQSIIGGLIISSDEYIVDLSLQKKIKNLRQAFKIS
jgi:ATP synthase F1 delta subunit